MQGEFGKSHIKFADLDFRLLVVGKLEIMLDSSTEERERQGGMDLLKTGYLYGSQDYTKSIWYSDVQN